MIRGGQTCYYHADPLGTVAAITDAKGAVVASYETDAFGNITAQKGSVKNPFVFSGREYEPALDRACEAIARFGADLLVCSFGADTFEGDPISCFRLKTRDYPHLARRIAQLEVPTLAVMEGGYAVDALGENVAAFLSGF